MGGICLQLTENMGMINNSDLFQIESDKKHQMSGVFPSIFRPNLAMAQNLLLLVWPRNAKKRDPVRIVRPFKNVSCCWPMPQKAPKKAEPDSGSSWLALSAPWFCLIVLLPYLMALKSASNQKKQIVEVC